jgi:hypothetical protein
MIELDVRPVRLRLLIVELTANKLLVDILVTVKVVGAVVELLI